MRVSNPKALYRWYEQHLGLESSNGCFVFEAATQRAAVAVSFFGMASDYFPVAQPAMLNFQVDPKRDRYEYGDFGWFIDSEGNRVELCQPKSSH